MEDLNLEYDYEYNVVDVANYKADKARSSYYKFIELNHSSMDGDLVESGVFRGRSLIATALLLKDLGSTKKVYGFDSFSGFPPIFHENDNIASFERLFKEGKISQEHYDAVSKNKAIRDVLTASDTNASTISSSGDFSDTNRKLLEKKIDLLNLDNIILVEGSFDETMNSKNGPQTVFACMMDNDLYQSHLTTFEFVWPRLVKGGLIYLDEYFSLKFPGSRIASDEFLADKSCNLQMYKSSPTDIFERWYVTKTSV